MKEIRNPSKRVVTALPWTDQSISLGSKESEEAGPCHLFFPFQPYISMESIYILAKLGTTYRRKPPSPSGRHLSVVPKLGCDRPSVYFGDQSHPSLRELIPTALLLPRRSPPVVPPRSCLVSQADV